MHAKNSLLGLQVYGDVDTVIKAIVKRSKAITSDDLSQKESIALRQSGENAVLIPGRGQLNTITAGEGLGFDDAGIRNGVDVIFASSSGAAVGYYWVAGMREAADIFYKRNVDNKLVDFFRNPILDIRTLEKEMKYRYPVNPQIFHDPKNTRLIIPVTEWNKGTNHFFEAGKEKNPLDIILASTLMPILSGFPRPKMQINIDGNIYVDGLMKPTLLFDAIANGAKNILLLTINPLDYRIPYSTELIKVVTYLAKRGIIPGAIREMFRYPKVLDEEFNQLQKYLCGDASLPQDVSLMVIAPTKVPLHSGSMDAKMLKATQEEAETFTKELLASYS